MPNTIKDTILDVADLSRCSCCERERFFEGLIRVHGCIVHQRSGYTTRHTAYHLVCSSCVDRDLVPPVHLWPDFSHFMMPVITQLTEAHVDIGELLAVQPMAEPNNQGFYMDIVRQHDAQRAKEIMLDVGANAWCACCGADCMKCGTIHYHGTVEHQRQGYTVRHTALHNVCERCASCASRGLKMNKTVLYGFPEFLADDVATRAMEVLQVIASTLVHDAVVYAPYVPLLKPLEIESVPMIHYSLDAAINHFKRVVADA